MGKVNFTQIEALLLLDESSEEKILPYVMKRFSEQLPEYCEQMKQFAQKKKGLEASYLAHKLKSSAGTLGLVEEEELCIKIELLFRQGKLDDALKLISLLCSLSEEDLAEIQRYLSGQQKIAA